MKTFTIIAIRQVGDESCRVPIFMVEADGEKDAFEQARDILCTDWFETSIKVLEGSWD